MATGLQSAINSLAPFASVLESKISTPYDQIYNENCHRIYSLAFWMTDNELTAEQLSANTFLRAFAALSHPTQDQIDRAFLAEVRELVPVGPLTLNCTVSPQTQSIHGNVKRIHLERSVVELPPTERMIFLLHDVEGYKHDRIARLLGISEQESKLGLHQARVQVRELIVRMS
ncbi:MAG TPA: RNA polymerase sigma factor [Candidatus Angelobacter sp.]|jgi:RNA polymerase sigma-70 factor (ECF subfamily)|nr:RNA polymerase sigma factor [Candidatus Angelobacter sp.]